MPKHYLLNEDLTTYRPNNNIFLIIYKIPYLWHVSFKEVPLYNMFLYFIWMLEAYIIFCIF